MPDKLFSKKNICSALGIVQATFDNWKKQGLIPPVPESSENPTTTFALYIEEIKQNTKNKLTARANRSASKEQRISCEGLNDASRKSLLTKTIARYKSFCKQKNLDEASFIEAAVVSLIICQLKSEGLLKDNWLESPNTRIERDCKKWVTEFDLQNKSQSKTENKIVDALSLKNTITYKNSITSEELITLFSSLKIQNLNDDFLGAFYQSVQNLSEKSRTGSFYTPSTILKDITIPVDKTVYDPCCGSGNILLNILSKNHDTSLIFVSDIDKTALKICEANLVMFFKDPEIKANLFERSILEAVKSSKKQFDFIVTNPPWGAKYSVTTKKKLGKQYKELDTAESFSISLYNASKMLSEQGRLYFILPKSFLSVKTHQGIRKYLWESGLKLSAKQLGHCFKDVVSEAIIFCAKKSEVSAGEQKVSVNEQNVNTDKQNVNTDKHNISTDKQKNTYKKIICSSPDYTFTLQDEQTDEIIKKIYSHPYITLGDNPSICDFALGIVTGDNKRFIQHDKTDKNEAVYRGKNIMPFYLIPSDEYLELKPEVLQQTAPEKYYRARKILYRFISDRVICCISEKGELPLNSANALIPKNDYPLETIVILFNSRLYSFLYKKKFDSLKILKSHIIQLPLPVLTSEEHGKFKKMYDKIISSKNKIDEYKATIKKADDEVFNIFGVNQIDLQNDLSAASYNLAD